MGGVSKNYSNCAYNKNDSKKTFIKKNPEKNFVLKKNNFNESSSFKQDYYS